MAQLVEFLTNRDTEGAAKLLAANVVCLSDGGGEFVAARVPVRAQRSVIVLIEAGARHAGVPSHTRAMELNGLFAVTTEREYAPEGYARKLVTSSKSTTRA